MEARWIHGNLVVTPEQQDAKQDVLSWMQKALGLPPAYARRLLQGMRVKGHGETLGLSDVVPERGKIVIRAGSSREKESHNSLGAVADKGWLDSDRPVILFEDEHLMVLDKPAGWLIHSDGSTTVPVLTDWVNRQLVLRGDQAQAHHVHRLDRDTTGCVLYAKHELMARALDALMSNRQIHRTYTAILAGRMPRPEGRIGLPIGRDRHIAGKYRVSETGKPAVTLYREVTCSKDENCSVVECVLLTGRTHQIRVHFAACGCPIVSDPLYGLREHTSTGGSTGQALHARKLDWVHPYTGESLSALAPFPAQFLNELVRCGLNPEVMV